MKNFLMGTMAAALMVACTSGGSLAVPKDTLEECVYLGDKTEFSVWAPDAEDAQLRLYHSASDEAAFKTVPMKLGKDGLWKVTVKEDVKGALYTFQVKKDGKWLEETAGIAAKAVGVNGMRGAVVDWDETDPEGWAEDKSPEIRPSARYYPAESIGSSQAAVILCFRLRAIPLLVCHYKSHVLCL